MRNQPRIDTLPSDRLQVLLITPPEMLSSREAREVADFIDRIGGFENAMLAMETLQQIERVA